MILGLVFLKIVDNKIFINDFVSNRWILIESFLKDISSCIVGSNNIAIYSYIS